jgi:hypothetical protein
LPPGNRFQQRGLARAIATDNAGTFLRRNQPVKIFKQKFRAESFAGPGQLQHEKV